MKKYLRMFVNYLQTAIEFKLDIFLMMAESIVSVLGGLILWISVFKSSQSIGGYSSVETISYFLLIPVVNFVTFTNIADDLGDQIRLGEFSNFLTKPLSLWKSQFIKMISEKVGFLSIVLPVYLFFLYLLSFSLPIRFGNFGNILMFAVFTFMGMLLNFFIDMMIVPMAFWFDEVWSFKHLKSILGLLFGGMMFPITIATGFYRQIIDFSPFKYIVYVPVSFLTGKMGIEDMGFSLIQVLGWIIIVAILGRLFFNFGIKSYSSNGN